MRFLQLKCSAARKENRKNLFPAEISVISNRKDLFPQTAKNRQSAKQSRAIRYYAEVITFDFAAEILNVVFCGLQYSNMEKQHPSPNL